MRTPSAPKDSLNGGRKTVHGSDVAQTARRLGGTRLASPEMATVHYMIGRQRRGRYRPCAPQIDEPVAREDRGGTPLWRHTAMPLTVSLSMIEIVDPKRPDIGKVVCRGCAVMSSGRSSCACRIRI
jgi:hypothetical protein